MRGVLLHITQHNRASRSFQERS